MINSGPKFLDGISPCLTNLLVCKQPGGWYTNVAVYVVAIQNHRVTVKSNWQYIVGVNLSKQVFK